MSDVLDPILFRRMELADIDAMGWLNVRLQRHFPSAPPMAIRSFLIQAHMSADQWLGRTDRAAAMAWIEPGILGNPPLIRVLFAFGENGEEDAEDVAELYEQITLWATRMNALGVELAPYMDGDRSYVRARIGKITKADRYFWIRPE